MPHDFQPVKRFAAVTEVQAGQLDTYRQLHAAAWPGVLQRLSAANIRNYSIHGRCFDDGRHFLFSYFEYGGTDFDADMAHIAADAETQRWWDVCKPCLIPFAQLPPGECWAPMTEVFYHA